MSKKIAKNAPRKSAAPVKDKSLESWIWDVACSIRGTKDAPKYKNPKFRTSAYASIAA